MARLLVKTHGVANSILELRLGVNRLGRGEDNHFRILHSTVSTHHCELTLGDGSIQLKDCGSTNGTFVNGNRVNEAWLYSGQTLRLGDVELFVECTEVKVAIPQYDRSGPAPVVLENGITLCPRHAESPVIYRCTVCREVMCLACVHRLRRRGGRTYRFCPICSGAVELVGGKKMVKKSLLGRIKRTVQASFGGKAKRAK